METPLQTATRLISALEELVAQESANLRNLDLVEAVQVTERAAPLVLKLGELAADPGVAPLRPRVEALIIQRQQSTQMLDAHLARMQSELRRIDEARARLSRVAPAYGSAPAAPRSVSRLNTAA